MSRGHALLEEQEVQWVLDRVMVPVKWIRGIVSLG